MKLNGKVPHIFSRDPALNTDAPGFEEALKKYRETGGLEGVLPCKEGCKPVVWQLRSLSEAAYSEVTRSSYHELQKRLGLGVSAILDRSVYGEQREAFRLGLDGADGAVDVNNSPIKLETELNGRNERVLTWKCVDALFQMYRAPLIAELGARVLELCELPPTSGQG